MFIRGLATGVNGWVVREAISFLFVLFMEACSRLTTWDWVSSRQADG